MHRGLRRFFSSPRGRLTVALRATSDKAASKFLIIKRHQGFGSEKGIRK
jgi:hypothetical protein